MTTLRTLRPDELAPGDTLTTATEIRRGDVVAFERTAPAEVTLRAVGPDEQAAHAGPLYRVDRGPDGQPVFAPLGA